MPSAPVRTASVGFLDRTREPPSTLPRPASWWGLRGFVNGPLGLAHVEGQAAGLADEEADAPRLPKRGRPAEVAAWEIRAAPTAEAVMAKVGNGGGLSGPLLVTVLRRLVDFNARLSTTRGGLGAFVGSMLRRLEGAAPELRPRDLAAALHSMAHMRADRAPAWAAVLDQVSE
eukprot:CAMPEP_0177609020 /NCGR_PEP_ID=MMETSP0419_2-20121207/18826_1 /TAXON_ID=582737 /ORGANISM="Tetraselmis sp., Strain GSL018" /LENGTH=172 /DNA_ID=CAMNT_0019103837 /DNA_START=464 /DNA_END=979 /DNA_ORIENTATION=+